MIIGLATLILMIFFGGGQTTFFLDPEVNKNVKEYVVDKEKEKQIEGIIKKMSSDQKAFFKKRKKNYTVKLKELNENYSSTQEDFVKIFADYMTELKNYQTGYWEKEVQIRNLISEEEWSQIMQKNLSKPSKDKTKKELDKAMDKMFDDISESCRKAVSDSSKLASLLDEVEVQKGLATNLVNDFLELNYKDLPSIRNKDTKLEELETYTDIIDDLRSKLLRQFTELRFELVKSVNEDEWKKLSKDLEGIYEGNTSITI